MNFENTNIGGVHIIEYSPFADNRGAFSRLFCRKEFEDVGLTKNIVQINKSVTLKKGSFRGLHYQIPPFSEAKIVSCLSGAVMDIVVDIRKDSATFLKTFMIELNSNNNKAIFIPEGFAHGFQTLTDNCVLLYFHTEYYSPGNETGINYLDPFLNLKLPLEVSNISDRDKGINFLESTFKGI